MSPVPGTSWGSSQADMGTQWPTAICTAGSVKHSTFTFTQQHLSQVGGQRCEDLHCNTVPAHLLSSCCFSACPEFQTIFSFVAYSLRITAPVTDKQELRKAPASSLAWRTQEFSLLTCHFVREQER